VWAERVLEFESRSRTEPSKVWWECQVDQECLGLLFGVWYTESLVLDKSRKGSFPHNEVSSICIIHKHVVVYPSGRSRVSHDHHG